ncbi:hypothetical protein PF010_g32732 [Phytophthora fragariae]|uniref:RxLR effector protein n=1 Tax=Phytophthora fragariae TaxID=53985 RepID=A0A6G0JE54_9STRA|nr:hypothetical protein PF003_g36562 [Phytophthora fragariae]KAE8879326.1 hypothetical protein PF003_g36564 [Phytophthora fragariae]KAE8879361.1 hypothetical protein PF003_g36561 [Phytophthora fragariae]KAE8879362.1 hypothetical protein PF003_g36560 [Phytophthora fragariae]KAE8879363.1 hypothetical protein PF003_g36563 [Phytophthora fragariae]
MTCIIDYRRCWCRFWGWSWRRFWGWIWRRSLGAVSIGNEDCDRGSSCSTLLRWPMMLLI